jgi:hypothetical protein
VMKVITPKSPAREPVTAADLAEIERSTVTIAEVTASATGARVEDVLTEAAAEAALTGRTPFEVLRRRKAGVR